MHFCLANLSAYTYDMTDAISFPHKHHDMNNIQRSESESILRGPVLERVYAQAYESLTCLRDSPFVFPFRFFFSIILIMNGGRKLSDVDFLFVVRFRLPVFFISIKML